MSPTPLYVVCPSHQLPLTVWKKSEDTKLMLLRQCVDDVFFYPVVG